MVRRIIFLASMTALVLALTAGSALGYSDYIKILSKQTTSVASVEGMYALGCMPCQLGQDRCPEKMQRGVFPVRMVWPASSTVSSWFPS
jgi:hypothetical protein